MNTLRRHCSDRDFGITASFHINLRWLGRFLIGLAFVAIAGVGCDSSSAVVSTQPDDQIPEASFSRLADSYDQRIAAITHFYARGILEIRWQDSDGNHFEQGNVDLWVQRPHNVSLRVEKLGETYLWAGQNQDLAWVFDMTGPDTILTIHDRKQSSTHASPSMSLLSLLGLSTIGDQVPYRSAPVRSAVSRTSTGLWQLSVADGSGTQQWVIEPGSYEPRRMRVLDGQDHELAQVEYEASTFIPVVIPGISILASPRVPGRLRLELPPVKLPDGSMSEPTRITLRVVKPDADVTDEPMDRVFNLQRLTNALEPIQVFRTQGSSWLGGGLIDPSVSKIEQPIKGDESEVLIP